METATGKKNHHSCVVCGTTDENVTYHRFPTDESARKVWIFRIPIKGFAWKESKRLCSKHFLPSDYKEVSDDSNKRRTKTAKTTPLKRKCLNPGAIPSIWPNTSPNSIKTPVMPRSSTMAFPSTRADIVANETKINDAITNIDKLRDREIEVPQSVLKICDKSSVMFVKLHTIESPRISYSVRINESLDYDITWENMQISSKELLDDKSLVQTKMSTFSYLIKLLETLDKKIDTITAEQKLNHLVGQIEDIKVEDKKTRVSMRPTSVSVQNTERKKIHTKYVSNGLHVAKCVSCFIQANTG